MPRTAAYLFALVFAAGCRPDSATPPSVSVRDSLGVSLVESAAPGWSESEAWTVSSDPAIEIGQVESEDAYQFFRVGGTVLLRDGRIVVTNGGSHEVRYYSGDGQHLMSVGGEGEGPGEFRFPRKVWRLPGDSVLVFDSDRVTLLDPNGAFVRSDRLTGPTPVGRFLDGAYLSLPFAAGVNPFAPGLARPDLALVRWTAGAAHPDTIGTVPGTEEYRVESPQGGISSYWAPFGRERTVLVHSDRIVTGDGTGFEVAVMDERGVLRSIFRRADIDRNVTRASTHWYERWRMSQARSDRQRQVLRRLFSEWTYPEQWPAFRRALIDTDGAIWLEHYPVDDSAAVWSVLAPDGTWLGEVTSPAGLHIHHITGNAIIGTATDELGVEYVRVHRLHRAPGENGG